MIDEMERLRDGEHLQQILRHYNASDEEGKPIWQPRVTELEDKEAPSVTKLHGELIAHSWVEQNTGSSPTCYRITPAGRRALWRIDNPVNEEELDNPELDTEPEENKCLPFDPNRGEKKPGRKSRRAAPSVNEPGNQNAEPDVPERRAA